MITFSKFVDVISLILWIFPYLSEVSQSQLTLVSSISSIYWLYIFKYFNSWVLIFEL